MKAQRVSMQKVAGGWLVRFHPGPIAARPHRPGKASFQRLMDLCNGDTVNVLHYTVGDRIHLEIHREA